MRDPVNCDKQLLWAALSLAKKDPHGEGLTRSSSESDYLEIVLPGRSAASPVQSPSGARGSGPTQPPGVRTCARGPGSHLPRPLWVAQEGRSAQGLGALASGKNSSSIPHRYMAVGELLTSQPQLPRL